MDSSSANDLMSHTLDVTINIRAKRSQRDFIDQAAEVLGKSRTEFMLEAAFLKAQDVLLNQAFFGLDELKFKQFMEYLDAPLKPNEKLNALLTTKSPWD